MVDEMGRGFVAGSDNFVPEGVRFGKDQTGNNGRFDYCPQRGVTHALRVRSRKLFVACLLLWSGALLADRELLPREMISIIPAGDWASGLLVGTDLRVGRAVTAEQEESPAILALDTTEGNCGQWTLTLLVPMQKIGSWTGQEIDARLGVDNQPVRDGEFHPTLDQGFHRYRLVLRRPPLDQSFVALLQGGTSLRIETRAASGKGADLFQFSLRGLKPAMERAARICSGDVEAKPVFPPSF